MDPADELICLGHDEDLAARHGAILPPIAQASLFAQPSFADLAEGLAHENSRFVYSRGTNPTVLALEQKLAALETGEKPPSVSPPARGDQRHPLRAAARRRPRVCSPTRSTVRRSSWPATSNVSGWRTTICRAARVRRSRPGLRDIPASFTSKARAACPFRQLDIGALAAAAKARGILTVVDNTWATPLFQKPLELGRRPRDPLLLEIHRRPQRRDRRGGGGPRRADRKDLLRRLHAQRRGPRAARRLPAAARPAHLAGAAQAAPGGRPRGGPLAPGAAGGRPGLPSGADRRRRGGRRAPAVRLRQLVQLHARRAPLTRRSNVSSTRCAISASASAGAGSKAWFFRRRGRATPRPWRRPGCRPAWCGSRWVSKGRRC